MVKEKLLVVEDDQIVAFSLRAFLEEEGYEVDITDNGTDAWELVKKNHYPLILTDINLPGLTGKQILENIKKYALDCELIIFTGYGSVGDAVECIKKGAYDYFTKPINNDKLLVSIKRALEHCALRRENIKLKEELSNGKGGSIIYHSKEMEEIINKARTVADTDATVLITGESGTGKTLLAKYIHENSKRAKYPFVEISCGALSETLLESELFGHKRGAFTGAHYDKKGKFEVANKGTIFLDDINSASLSFQTKLLRIIEERVFERVGEIKTRKSSARIITATNLDLREESKKGNFREDLYYRLNVVNLELPPLRSRKEDIPFLIHHFITKTSIKYRKKIEKIDNEAFHLLCSYQWPGNIRELENTIERLVIFSTGNTINHTDIPEYIIEKLEQSKTMNSKTDDQSLSKAIEEHEKLHIMKVLEMTKGNRYEAAKILNVSRATLYNKLKKYNLL